MRGKIEIFRTSNPALDWGDFHAGASAQSRLSCLNLEQSDVLFVKEDLAVEVGEVDTVIVDQNQPTDTGAGQTTGHPTAQSTTAKDRNGGLGQLCLHGVGRGPLRCEIAEIDQLAVVALKILS